MTALPLKATGGRLTTYGKRMVAASMYAKGKNFLGAAMLLRKKGGYEYVVLHLLCQGIEITLKALLLVADYDAYKPKLRKYGRSGHDFSLTAIDTLSAFGLSPLRAPIKEELQALSVLYSKHVLRYGSFHDILVDPQTISSQRVLRRMAAVLRLAEREFSRIPSSNTAPQGTPASGRP
jgi:hypothetical protein